MDIERRGKGRYLHVVSPFAGLSHLLHMLFELLLQLLLRVVCGIDASGQRSRGGAFGVPPHAVDGHVLAVEVCVVAHMLNGRDAKDVVHILVAIELVGQGIEQAVALG